MRLVPKGVKYVIGVDEVGRGPLAGPLCVGAFAARVDFDLGVFEGARDSKKMTPEAREAYFRRVKERHRRFASEKLQPEFLFTLSFISPARIDRLGLTKSTHLAIRNCLRKLSLNPQECLVLLDGGLRAPKQYLFQETIIKGDDKERIISLAAIMAKVSRDHRLVRLSKRYPAYNFHKHKGYATAEHRSQIKILGACPIHRQSFLTKILPV